MSKFKLIIFDIDGTLVNSYPAIISSVNYTLDKLNLERPSKEKIIRAVGWGDKALLLPFVGEELVDEALKIYRKHHKKALVEKTKFMPSAKRILIFLKKRGYKLAIASNRPRRFSNILLRHLKINKFFDYILCKDEIKFGKPHPSILRKIMQRIGVSRAQTLYVGDMAIDIKTGRRAKVTTFAVATGSSAWRELKKEKPDYLSKSLAKLFKIVF